MSTKKTNNNIIAVIGAGAAGMFAACISAANGSEVLLFEKNEYLGRKLGITGKGRCNLTNNCDVEEFLLNVINGSKFLYSALYSFTPQMTMQFFNQIGLELKTERGNRVFPASDKAADVVNALRFELNRLGVKVIHSKVSELICDNKQIGGVKTKDKIYKVDKVILATGGKSYPATGSTGDGYIISKKLGHTVTKLSPSLIPLETEGDIATKLQGLSLKNVAIKIKDNTNGKYIYSDFGEMLFTHFGVSGPMILSASSHMKDIESGKYEIHIDMKPALSTNELDKRILSDFEKYKNRDIINALNDLLPSKMIPVFIKTCGIDEREKVNSVDKAQRLKIVSNLKDFELTVTKARPIDEAIITSGGVSLKEINSSTMESKIIKGLYFAGEIIDADAYTGGFNLQIAFSTAYLAAISAREI